jgi:hypothetical protein
MEHKPHCKEHYARVGTDWFCICERRSGEDRRKVIDLMVALKHSIEGVGDRRQRERRKGE